MKNFRIACSVILFILHNPFVCSTLTWLPIVSMMVFINIISGGLSLALAMLSAQGTILDVERRKHVTTLICARLPVFIVEFIWTLATTLIALGIFLRKTCNLLLQMFSTIWTQCARSQWESELQSSWSGY